MGARGMRVEKQYMQVITIGHVDHGKSTVFGHLYRELGLIDDATMRKLEKVSEEIDKKSFKYAFYFDTGKEEQSRGITINLARREFVTKNYVFTLIDAPGHRDFVKNMITGASAADVAVLVISARPGEAEAGLKSLDSEQPGQTIEHLFICQVFGIPQVIVVINKMDTCDWSRERFDQIKQKAENLLKEIGYNLEQVPIIPVSGWTGDNLVTHSTNMKWYKGQTLMEALDSLKPPQSATADKLPLRIPIQKVYKFKGVGTVPIGRVETGILKQGDKVVVEPYSQQGWVRSIEREHKRLEEALPGDGIACYLLHRSKDLFSEDLLFRLLCNAH